MSFVYSGGTDLTDVRNVLHPEVEAATRGLVAAGKGPFIKVPGGYGSLGLEYKDRSTGVKDLTVRSFQWHS
jgi:hypothetical protein